MKRTLLLLTVLVASGAGVNPSLARGQVADGPAARARGVVALESLSHEIAKGLDTLVARVRGNAVRTADNATASHDLEVPTDTLVARLARKRALIQVDAQWRTGQLRNDGPLLDSVLADGWTTVVWGSRSGEQIETKAQYLNDVLSGIRRYQSIVDEGVGISIQGDVGVVTGSTTSSGYLRDEFLTGRSQFARMYTIQQGRWQMLATASMALP
jgi:hypothetical protein